MSFEPASGIPTTGAIVTGFGFDVAETLPPLARDRLRQLRQRSKDAHSLMVPFADIQSLSTDKVIAEQRLKQLRNPRPAGGFDLRDSDPRVVEQLKLVDKLTDELQRLTALQETRAATWRPIGQLTAAVEAWARDGKPPGTTLQDFDGEPPKLLKGESLLDGISRLQRRGRELKADLHRIRSAPFPSSHAKAKMRAEIEALAMSGAPSVSELIEHDRRIVWAMRNVQSQVFNAEAPSLAFGETHDLLPLFAWLHRDALIKALDREIDTEADDGASLTHEARQKAEAEVMGDLLAVERDEAALTWQAQDQRLPVEHRSDINLVALLGCVIVTALRTNGGGSSPDHAGYDFIRGGR
jgi:hypothetical protein